MTKEEALATLREIGFCPTHGVRMVGKRKPICKPCHAELIAEQEALAREAIESLAAEAKTQRAVEDLIANAHRNQEMRSFFLGTKKLTDEQGDLLREIVQKYKPEWLSK